MNPTDLTTLIGLLKILQQMSTWPFGVFMFLVVVGPWMFSFMSERAHRRQLRTTLEQYRSDVSEIKRLYESNARLVDDCTRAFFRLDTVYQQAVEVISLNTQTQTELVKSIEGNQYCPIVRSKGKPTL